MMMMMMMICNYPRIQQYYYRSTKHSRVRKEGNHFAMDRNYSISNLAQYDFE